MNERAGEAAPRGRFITFEGGEGAGKTTQIALLAGQLEHAGIEVVRTREPGGSPGAEEIRRLLVEGEPERWDPLTEALLHNAARRDHLCVTIAPALEAGQWVLCDRFADSTLAYQGYGHGLGVETLRQLAAIVLADMSPDLTLILDVTPETGLDRAAKRQESGTAREDRYERMAQAFHRRVADGFRAIAAADPGRCIVVDAGDPPEVVNAAVCKAVSERLGQALP